MGLLLHSFSSKHGLDTIPVIYTILYFCSGRSVDVSVGKIFGPNQLISDAGMCCNFSMASPCIGQLQLFKKLR